MAALRVRNTKLRMASALAIAAWTATSCTTLGTNVKGSFSCTAPAGSCAPTSNIDDQALAMLQGDPVGTTPAGPFLPAPATKPGIVLASASSSLRRSGEKVVRIVFPAFIDGQGRYHEASAIHAVVDQGAWVRADLPGRGPGVASETSGGSLGELASAAPEMAFNRTEQVASEVPAAAAVAAAPTKAQIEAARSRRVSVVAPAARAPAPVPVASATAPASATASTPSLVDVRGRVEARLATIRPVLAAKEERRAANGPSVFPVGSVQQ